MKLYDIPDFTGYKISREGKVYSMIPRGCRDRFNKTKWLKEPKELKIRYTRTGYCRVYMRRDSTGKREDVYIHRIVAELFIPNPNHCSDVNHKDCNPQNNNVENLEWMTHQQNLDYGMKYGNRARNEKGQFCHK